MARSTVYNSITNPEKLAKISTENKQLGEDWLEYMQSIDRSPTVISCLSVRFKYILGLEYGIQQ